MARLFIAVDLSVAVVERLALLQAELTKRLGDDVSVRWVDAPNIHVTLMFLGEVDEALVPLLEDSLAAMARPLFPFEVRCCRLGGFPDLEHPRIVWAGLDDKGAEVMGLLRQTIEHDVGELGLAGDEREYVPHLTLGRVRSAVSIAAEDIADLVDLDFGSSYVKDLVLFESKLSSHGAEYIVRRRFSLGEA